MALSFAGAQRDYVEQVAEALKARGVRCFYDADEQIELWGKYLAEELPAIYGEQAAAVVVFVSAEYAARDWTRLERRAALTRAVRERREYVLPARFDDTPLPGLLSDMVTVDLRTRTPQQFAAMIADKLAALGITAPARQPRRGEPPGTPRRRVRLGRCGRVRPIRGGWACMRRSACRGCPMRSRRSTCRGMSMPPSSVSGPRWRPRRERGGFVLLVGGSSVGKTRCAVEAVKALLPDWWLVHPAGPAEVAALAPAPPPRTVVWLDELQRYLDGEHGLTGGVVRALLNAPHPAVIIGTLWPDRYTAYTTVPAPGGADPHAREREVLDLAAVVRIDPEFSPAEQDRARAAAARDPRLRVALESAGYGLTQTLAAAPQLVARWQDAQTADPYAWAVLTAALDVARLGARAPLSADLLRAAAPGYCTSQQQAEAPENWFEQALAYATGKLHGAAAALSPAGAGMGQVAGYTVADYLIQHASRERRYARVPASTWDAVLSHIRDPADAARLADSARTGCCTATPSRCTVTPPTPATGTPPGGWPSCWPSAATWTGLSRCCAPGPTPATGTPPGSWPSCWPSAVTWTGCGPGPTPATRPPPGGWPSCWPSAVTWTGCAPGPTPATGTPPCGWPICWPSAVTWTGPRSLRARADAGDGDAAWRLADLLAERGDLDGACRCCARADAGDGMPPGGWPSCWPSAATWTGCGPGPTPATGTPPGGWPSCWPSAATWTGCAPGPTPATGTPPCGWPICWPSAATWTGPRRCCAPGPTPATGCRRAAGRAAGRARRPGRGRADPARPGRRRRRVRRLAAGRAAGRAR